MRVLEEVLQYLYNYLVLEYVRVLCACVYVLSSTCMLVRFSRAIGLEVEYTCMYMYSSTMVHVYLGTCV